jgi:hypothetical protein
VLEREPRTTPAGRLTGRTGALGVLGGLALVVPFLVGWTQAPEPDDGRVAFRLEDPRIVESSGLVATRGRVVTVNDSGDGGRVFTVDPADGRTVGVTSWEGDPDDVEALAPAGPGEVWVGDIGDNRGVRDTIRLLRVPVGTGERTVTPETVELAYRGGGRDAEALLAHPVTGRVYVVTKGVLAGEVHAVPADLDGPGPHRMRQVGQVTGIVTDGAFLPDGRHLVLRTYTRAVVYAFPSLEQVGAWDLPEQEQGEGLAVLPDGSLLLSSEGQGSEVLREELPAGLVPPASPATGPTLWDLLAGLFDR